MPSGQQLSQENYQTFVAWRQSKSDEDWRDLIVRGQLSRKDIAAECCFARSVLVQNPRIREALEELENSLRERKVLPQMEPYILRPCPPPDTSVQAHSQARDAERLKRAEQENASLRIELEHVKGQLRQYAVLQDALAQTGRLPR